MAGFRLGRLDLIVDSAALLFGLVVALAGQPLGIVLAGAAGFALLTTRFHPLQRWLISVRFRSLLGRTTNVIVDADGLRFEGELGRTFIPWSSVTTVRSNSQTVAFVRDRVLVGYIPASAFQSAAAKADLVLFAGKQINSNRSVQRGR